MEPVPFLLVDDLEENLLSLDALLRQDDLLLLKARSGDEALELLLEHDVALALIDVQMPGLDGFELMRRLKRDRAAAPVAVALSASASLDDARRALEAGFSVHVAKPIGTSDLVETVRAVAPPASVRSR